MNNKYAFVDVETTGLNPGRGRVIEVAVYRMEDEQIVMNYESLVDPEEPVSEEILRMTGIGRDELTKAPTFRAIADEVADLLDGAVFVAHNARFDYAFLRSEFKRLGVSFNSPLLCTAKLLRKLRPDLDRHNLDVLISEYELECEQRHRAGPDAKALADFFRAAPRMHGAGFWNVAFKMLKRPSWPHKLAHISPSDIPESPGVYIFKGEDGVPIYIGKSKNIRDRVINHFGNDDELKLIQTVCDIEYVQTAGEMGALLLESQLIKKHLPLYNRMLRKSEQMVGVFQSNNESGLMISEFRIINKILPEDIENLLGVFKSKRAAQDAFRRIAEEKRLCPQVLGLENGKGACFWKQLEKCDGVCCGEEPIWKHNAKFVEAIHPMKIKQWPYQEPVTIREEFEGKRSGWVVDRWCLIKHLTENEDGGEDEYTFEPEFDWDTYKILKKFLLKS